MQPRDRTLHNPAKFDQPDVVSCHSLRKYRLDAHVPQFEAVRVGIVGAISFNNVRLSARSAACPANLRNRVLQRNRLCDVMRVCRGENKTKRNASCISNHMMLASKFPAIRRIGARFRPPKTTRMEELSANALLQSILSASRNLASRIWRSFSQTSASCHLRRYRQQLMPLPQPISWGNSSHGMPVRNTKRMPVMAFQGSIGLQPVWRNRLVWGGSGIGSMIAHISSLICALAICKLPKNGCFAYNRQRLIAFFARFFSCS